MPYNGLFIGLTTVDIQFFVEKFPQSNKKVKTEPPSILVGGPATNAAVAFAHLNKGANLVSVVGKNPFSSFIQTDFSKTQIQFTDLVASQDTNPVLASVITSKENGNRNIFTHHPETVQPEINPKQLVDSIQPDILLLDGFYHEFAVECARLANERQIPVVLDCGSWKPQYEQLLQHADIAICSADFYPPGCSTTNDVYDFLKRKKVIRSAISRGGQSLLFQDEKGRGEVPVEIVKAIDTLGAGDFLHGAFCYYYLQFNFNFENALKKAVNLASFSCRFEGTRTWINFTK
jgi:sugar/nucleoside kinase (ribokinase family)